MNRILAVCTLILGATAAAHAFRAPEAWDDISFTGKFAYTSGYAFRGIQQADSNFQTALEVGYPVYQGNVYAGMWDAAPLDAPERGNELDFYLGYTIPVGKYMRADVGQIYYWFAQSRTFSQAALYRGFNRSTETYFGLVYDTTELFGDDALKPSLYYYYDWNVDKHTVEASLSYAWNLARLVGVEGLTLTPAVVVGAQTACRPYGDTGAAAARFARVGNVYYEARVALAYALNAHTRIYAEFYYAGQQDTATGDGLNTDAVGGGVGVQFGL